MFHNLTNIFEQISWTKFVARNTWVERINGIKLQDYTIPYCD